MNSENTTALKKKIVEASEFLSAYSEGLEKAASYMEDLGKNMEVACIELDRAGKSRDLSKIADSLGDTTEKLKELKSALANFGDRGSLVRRRIEEATRMMSLIRDISSRTSNLCKKFGQLRQEDLPALLEIAQNLEDTAARARSELESVRQVQRQEERIREEIRTRVEKLVELTQQNDMLQSQIIEKLLHSQDLNYAELEKNRLKLLEEPCQDEPECIALPQKVMPKINEGDCIVFGKMGALQLVWIVLEKLDDRLLLFSRYGLEIKPFHTGQRALWGGSSLREYLNNKFVGRCFTKEERKLFLTEENTNGQIFLLSIREAEMYLRGSSNLKCRAVEGNHVASLSCEWWLRTSSEDNSKAAYVNKEGIIIARGKKIVETNTHIRPAMWIKLPGDKALTVLDGRGNFIYEQKEHAQYQTNNTSS